jgi:hypothetical protein
VTEELDVQEECQKELVTLVNRLRRAITDQANEIKNRAPNVTERSLILSSSVSKLNEIARVILQVRTIDATDEMHVLLGRCWSWWSMLVIYSTQAMKR